MAIIEYNNNVIIGGSPSGLFSRLKFCSEVWDNAGKIEKKTRNCPVRKCVSKPEGSGKQLIEISLAEMVRLDEKGKTEDVRTELGGDS